MALADQTTYRRGSSPPLTSEGFSMANQIVVLAIFKDEAAADMAAETVKDAAGPKGRPDRRSRPERQG